MLFVPVAFGFFYLIASGTAGPIVVNIAHLTEYADDWRAVQFALGKAYADGVLDPAKVQFKIYNDTSCVNFDGVVNAATLYYERNISLILGPACSNEMLSVGELANAQNWNVAIIGYVTIDQSFADKSIYSTMARTSLAAADSMANILVSLANLYGWTQVALVGSNTATAVRVTTSIQTAFQASGIKINLFVQFGGNITEENITASAQFQQIQQVARIVIVMMDSDISTALPVMQAASALGMTSDQYVFILPWILHTFRGNNYPWEYADGSIDAPTKLLYKNALVVDVQQYSRKITDVFDVQFALATGATTTESHTYMPEIDAFYLYCLALRDALKATGDNEIHRNGSEMWNHMRGQVYSVNGSDGQVFMDYQAERYVSFTIWLVTDNMTTVSMEQVMDFQARVIANCTPDPTNATKCLYKQLIVFQNLSMIADMPACGFQGQLCNKTTQILIAAAVIVVILGSIVGFFWYRRYSVRKLYQMPWRVPIDEVTLIEPSQITTSLISVDSIRKSRGTLGSVRTRQMGAVLQGTWGLTNVAIKRYRQKGTITFTRTNLELLFQLRQTSHDNLNGFVGLCFNQRNEFMVLWRLCQRGSLQDLLFNDDLKLDTNFQSSFARDVTSGLDYLHRSPLGFHGRLTTSNCLVDAHWIVKLTDFGIEDFLDDLLLDQHEISPYEVDDTKALTKSSTSNKLPASQSEVGTWGVQGGTKCTSQRVELLHAAPEQLVEHRISGRYRGTAAGDIYSLAMVLYQILYRIEPFSDSLASTEDILEQMIDPKAEEVRPQIPKEPTYHPELINLLKQCWDQKPENRPDAPKARKYVNDMLRASKGSLVDQMIKMMEQYANSLEVLVKDRTAMLEEAREQADRLLSQMLPPSIAADLKVGKNVQPQTYEGATVLFTDIVGFTTLCSGSSPLEIVALLNDLFSGFDDVIGRYSAYKVETIGDAYMVVSGLPTKNGDRHVEQIAHVGLQFREFLERFTIAHRPNERLNIRIGFHSGPVAAGVVGLAAPRYCLFGDTVNVASRMESTGEAGKIQISTESHFLLSTKFSAQFITQHRGIVTVKGKGEVTTYWLISAK